MRKKTDVIIINGYAVPAPDEGYTISESTVLDGGRNANNAVVGQIKGRNLWKISDLQWSRLSVEEWARLKKALSPFYVNVTFTNDVNERVTVMMYPSDRTSKPCNVNAKTSKYGYISTGKFNLIDCGY